MRWPRKSRDDDGAWADWLEHGYPTAYRAAYLILLDRGEAERAVDEGLRRAWHFRAAAPGGSGLDVWMYRAVVHACERRLRRGGVAPAVRGDAEDPLSALAAGDRIALVLVHQIGMDEREAAHVMGRRPAAFRRLVQEASMGLMADAVWSGAIGSNRQWETQ